MKILSIIGTRPQYIKVKPIFDYCKEHKIDHKIIDTRQHYSYSVSGSLIKDLDLNIHKSLPVNNTDEIGFISSSSRALFDIIMDEQPDYVLIYGDTNSTFSAALAAYKAGVSIAHIEAGERCFDMSVPEEVNRIFADGVSTLNFCSSKRAVKNLSEPLYCGDLEYELLNSIDPDIFFEDFGVMTIHRNENASQANISRILSFCDSIPYNIKLFAHHRTRRYLKGGIPENITVLDPCSYTDMVDNMAKCKFIITDSGGIQKTSAFFGKKTLVMRSNTEWKEVERSGYAKLFESRDVDIKWLLDVPPDRSKRFYLPALHVGNPSGIIFSEILKEKLYD